MNEFSLILSQDKIAELSPEHGNVGFSTLSDCLHTCSHTSSTTLPSVINVPKPNKND